MAKSLCLDSDDSEELPEVEVPETKLKPVAEPDPKFFEKVTKDASRIIQKEKIQEQYQKVCARGDR